jgi:hypothetical protein
MKERRVISPKLKDFTANLGNQPINLKSRFSQGCARGVVYLRISQDEVERITKPD